MFPWNVVSIYDHSRERPSSSDGVGLPPNCRLEPDGIDACDPSRTITKIDVGQGAVLGFDWTKNAVRWGRNADYGNEVSEQDGPKEEKF